MPPTAQSFAALVWLWDWAAAHIHSLEGGPNWKTDSDVSTLLYVHEPPHASVPGMKQWMEKGTDPLNPTQYAVLVRLHRNVEGWTCLSWRRLFGARCAPAVKMLSIESYNSLHQLCVDMKISASVPWEPTDARAVPVPASIDIMVGPRTLQHPPSAAGWLYFGDMKLWGGPEGGFDNFVQGSLPATMKLFVAGTIWLVRMDTQETRALVLLHSPGDGAKMRDHDPAVWASLFPTARQIELLSKEDYIAARNRCEQTYYVFGVKEFSLTGIPNPPYIPNPPSSLCGNPPLSLCVEDGEDSEKTEKGEWGDEGGKPECKQELGHGCKVKNTDSDVMEPTLQEEEKDFIRLPLPIDFGLWLPIEEPHVSFEPGVNIFSRFPEDEYGTWTEPSPKRGGMRTRKTMPVKFARKSGPCRANITCTAQEDTNTEPQIRVESGASSF